MSVKMLDLHKIKLGPNEVILDVRGADEYKSGHIPGAINIPVGEVALRVHELKQFSKVYIHCKRGGRAVTAYNGLVQAGLTNLVCISDAGMDLWLESGLPVNTL